MDNREEGFDSLSQMLSRNKSEKAIEKAQQNDISRRSYDPSADIAMSENDDNSSTKLIDNIGKVNMSSSELPKNPVRENEDRKRTPPKSRSKKRKPKKSQAEIRAEKHKRAGITAIMVSLSVLLTAAIVFVSVKLGLFTLNSALDYTGLSTNEFKLVVQIPDDPTVNQVSEVLYENGIITSKKFFELYSGMKNADSDYVGGEFELSSVMSYSQIIEKLQASKTEKYTVEVRIIEGMTAREIGLLLEENSICKASDFMKYYKDKMNLYSFEKRLEVNSRKFYQLEGYLFPDTYEFYVCNELKEDPSAAIDTSKEAESAAKKIYSNFSTKITKSMYKSMNEKGFTLNELITLASIVQKEAGTIEDMGYIASVFINRLNDSGSFPKLESDVTVFYVQNEIEPYYYIVKPDATLNLLSNNYDTYDCIGIPSGPICSPGMDAIQAVLNAPKTNYFYFCANEETGETFYAATLEEHENNLVLAGITG